MKELIDSIIAITRMNSNDLQVSKQIEELIAEFIEGKNKMKENEPGF